MQALFEMSEPTESSRVDLSDNIWAQTRYPPASGSFGFCSYHIPSALVLKSYGRFISRRQAWSLLILFLGKQNASDGVQYDIQVFTNLFFKSNIQISYVLFKLQSRIPFLFCKCININLKFSLQPKRYKHINISTGKKKLSQRTVLKGSALEYFRIKKRHENERHFT